MMVMLWSILFVIPGYIALYRYAMTPYIMAENENLSVMEAITESKQIMMGNKWRLFCLDLSFLGWELLGILTLGIGFSGLLRIRKLRVLLSIVKSLSSVTATRQ